MLLFPSTETLKNLNTMFKTDFYQIKVITMTKKLNQIFNYDEKL